MELGPKLVVALGGNALVKADQRGTVTEQFANTRAAILSLMDLVRAGFRIVLTHGNGPQVGNIMIRVEAALGQAYSLPLGVAVAESQGEMGYMIAQTLQNRLILEKIHRPVVSVLTQVVCDRDDPSIRNPTKPIGPFYTRAEAERLMAHDLIMVEDAGRGWRHVVPSPYPRQIVEREVIRLLLDQGILIIAAGGGGMPVYVAEDGTFEGIDGVVDKDLASSLLAREVGADDLLILTGVERVAVDFGKPSQRWVGQLSLSEARELLAEGQFPLGSMGPKIQAAIEFLQAGGRSVLITAPEKVSDAYLRRSTGTWVTESGAPPPPAPSQQQLFTPAPPQQVRTVRSWGE
jgi:carbamate kinase